MIPRSRSELSPAGIHKWQGHQVVVNEHYFTRGSFLDYSLSGASHRPMHQGMLYRNLRIQLTLLCGLLVLCKILYLAPCLLS